MKTFPDQSPGMQDVSIRRVVSTEGETDMQFSHTLSTHENMNYKQLISGSNLNVLNVGVYQPRRGVEWCYVDSTMMMLVPGRVAAVAGDPCHSRQPRQLESAAESWAETRRAAEQPRSSCRVRRCCCWPNSLCRSAECLPCLPAAAALVGSSCIEPAAARPPPSPVPRLRPHRC